MPRSATTGAVHDGRAGLTQGTGANILVRTESRPAGLPAQQAQKPAVGTGDSGSPSPGRDHRPAHFSQAGPGRHRAAFKPSQRRSGSIRTLTPSDVVTFHNSLEVAGRTDDQRGMHMIVTEEVAYLTDGGAQRMPCGSRDHRLGGGRHDLIHRSRIRTPVRSWSPAVPSSPGRRGGQRPRLGSARRTLSVGIAERKAGCCPGGRHGGVCCGSRCPATTGPAAAHPGPTFSRARSRSGSG